MSKIKFHIDDFGLTKSISNNLIFLLKKKPNSIKTISIIVNTNKKVNLFAKKILKINNKISIYLHLNLVDGKPLSKKLTKIVNTKGFFKNSFLKLLLIRFNPFFKIYKLEIKKEIENQIKVYLKLLKNINYKNPNQIYLDSHQHLHMLPWVFDLILELSKKYNIIFIRSTSEPFILSDTTNIFKVWFYKNLLKFIILRTFNYINLKKIKLKNIKTNQFFYGIINSGHMNNNYIKKIKKLKKSNYQILFHPNIAHKNEKNIFDNEKKIEYYLSKERAQEYNFLGKN